MKIDYMSILMKNFSIGPYFCMIEGVEKICLLFVLQKTCYLNFKRKTQLLFYSVLCNIFTAQ